MPFYAKVGIPALLALIVIIIIVIIVIFSKKKQNGKKIKVDQAFIDSLVETLGDITNITEVLVDNARLKIKLKNTDICNFDKLKELSPQGVFITGNYVKVLFKYDSKIIKNEIEKRNRR